MALSRRALFGFPPPQPPSSVHTVRLVPLTQGMNQNTAWPLLPPGSAQSMTNFLPLNGTLAPRSRLSATTSGSILPSGLGMTELYLGTGLFSPPPQVWYSSNTQHAIVSSNGSISRASFTSAFGLGVAPSDQQHSWQYAQSFFGTIDSNALVAAGIGAGSSADTLLVLYGTPPQFSYLTSAPRAFAVASFDNYLVAWNVTADGVAATTRVQWCVRGEPSNWTGEGSGFEDLLEMRGAGTSVWPMPDGRIVLFSDTEIWYGVRATYPAQFNFYPLDPDVGCIAPRTIARCPEGLLFLGTDSAIRILPSGGGKSRVLVSNIPRYVGHKMFIRTLGTSTWGLYDQVAGLYYLFVERGSEIMDDGMVVNVLTGEVGLLSYDVGNDSPFCGVALSASNTSTFNNEGLLFASRAGQVYSANSSKDMEGRFGLSVVTSTWRSTPIAADLAGDWKQLLDVNVDYRATSRSTLTLRIAADGNTFEDIGRAVSLASAPIVGRVQSQVYTGGFAPTLELISTSTGYELHRIDVGMNIGGRRA
jgi:hypothetical protein